MTGSDYCCTFFTRPAFMSLNPLVSDPGVSELFMIFFSTGKLFRDGTGAQTDIKGGSPED